MNTRDHSEQSSLITGKMKAEEEVNGLSALGDSFSAPRQRA